MTATTVSQLLPILQTSIGPVILISGVGLLLLTLTNRFGRMLDRARQLNQDLGDGPPADKAGVAPLSRRSLWSLTNGPTTAHRTAQRAEFRRPPW